MGDEVTEGDSPVPDLHASVPFSGRRFIIGLLVALVVGCLAVLCATVVAGSVGISVGIHLLGFVIGAVPGIVMAAIGLWRRGRGGLGEGLLVGACMILLIGSLCGGLAGEYGRAAKTSGALDYGRQPPRSGAMTTTTTTIGTTTSGTTSTTSTTSTH